MSDLDKLIEAVEAGDVSDWAFGSGYPRTALGSNWEAGLNAYCGSLDAALALHEALLPGRPASLTLGGEYGASAHYAPTWDSLSITCCAPTPARAWLLAILRAYRDTMAPQRP